MSTFRFVDLFAGIGGFHAALSALGGECVYVAEMDDDARAVYKTAWLADVAEDFPFTRDINDDVPPLDDVSTIAELAETARRAGGGTLKHIPDFDVLAAGFPCQAFSKSGHQKGVLDETRGTLFYNILRIVAEKHPKIVFLENVRNLVGPKHRDSTFRTIVEALRGVGYVVSDKPTLISPHKIANHLGGGPQVRERVYIMAIRRDLAVNETEFPGFDFGSWDPTTWRIAETKLWDEAPAAISEAWLRSADPETAARLASLCDVDGRDLAVADEEWVAPWRDLLAAVVNNGLPDGAVPFPGHPIWFRVAEPTWRASQYAEAAAMGQPWKADFVRKSVKFLDDYATEIDAAGAREEILALGNNSWKKLEWQAGDARSLDECLIQLRPSGIRIKKATYAPALVAITQTPILGSDMRRLSPYEAGRLQGFPDRVYEAMARLRHDGSRKPEQWDRAFYKQFGNAVHVGAVKFALVQFMGHHFRSALPDDPALAGLYEACSQTRVWDETVAPSIGTPTFHQPDLMRILEPAAETARGSDVHVEALAS